MKFCSRRGGLGVQENDDDVSPVAPYCTPPLRPLYIQLLHPARAVMLIFSFHWPSLRRRNLSVGGTLVEPPEASPGAARVTARRGGGRKATDCGPIMDA